MSKRNRPTTAAQAAHRRRRHAYRSALNAPKTEAAPAAGKGRAGAPKPVAAPAPKPVAAAASRPAAAPAAAAPKPAAPPAAAPASKPPGEG